MEDFDFDAWCDYADRRKKAEREGTIADQRISPTIVHVNCDPGDSHSCECGRIVTQAA